MQMTRYRWISLVTATLLGFLVASVTRGYTIVLKDGTQLEARNEFTVTDGVARIELINGNVISIQADEIDLEKTHDFNARNLGSTVAIEGSETVPHESGIHPNRSLDDLLRQRKAAGQDARGIQQPRMPRTPSGYPDLTQLRRESYTGEAADSLQRSLSDAGIEVFRLFEGTAADRVLIEIQTSDEAAVFAALLATARAFSEVVPGSPLTTLELLMVTPGQKRAGQFEIGEDAARVLNEGALSPADFFMQYVEF